MWGFGWYRGTNAAMVNFFGCVDMFELFEFEDWNLFVFCDLFLELLS